MANLESLINCMSLMEEAEHPESPTDTGRTRKDHKQGDKYAYKCSHYEINKVLSYQL